jgi:dipeptidase E
LLGFCGDSLSDCKEKLMKKMFLASSFVDVADLFVKFTDGKCEGKTITFIPTASLPEEENFWLLAV